MNVCFNLIVVLYRAGTRVSGGVLLPPQLGVRRASPGTVVSMKATVGHLLFLNTVKLQYISSLEETGISLGAY